MNMTNEIIELLPSADLKAKIKETNHQFKEIELLDIIYTYAPTFDARIDLLERFSGIASADISALAKAYIEYEQGNFLRFSQAPAGFVYELCIKDTPDAYEEKYLCASYPDALVCIDRFYEEYADINAKETEQTRYKITKRKIFSKQEKFDEDAYAECVLGPGKTVLEVSDHYHYFEDFCEKKGICHPDNDFDCVRFPCFVEHKALVKYWDDYQGKQRFGVCLCWTKDSCDGLADFLYLVPLDSPTICEHRFNGDDHDHVATPKVMLASPIELDAIMRKNYFDYLVFLDTEQDAKIQRLRQRIAVCDECGSEYLASKSKMASLCPECAHILYGKDQCNHEFKDGKCTLCLWDGSRSNYINELLKNN